jgi:hypothetical protein
VLQYIIVILIKFSAFIGMNCNNRDQFSYTTPTEKQNHRMSCAVQPYILSISQIFYFLFHRTRMKTHIQNGMDTNTIRFKL